MAGRIVSVGERSTHGRFSTMNSLQLKHLSPVLYCIVMQMHPVCGSHRPIAIINNKNENASVYYNKLIMTYIVAMVKFMVSWQV